GFIVMTNRNSADWGIGNGGTQAYAINRHDGIVGTYTGDFDLRIHGYLRDTELPVGLLTYPIDYPGATDTFLYGLNDGGRVIVGKYVDSAGAIHGLILQRPDTWTSYDYPDAIETSLKDISNNKLVSGYYVDSSGTHHGFIGKVQELA